MDTQLETEHRIVELEELTFVGPAVTVKDGASGHCEIAKLWKSFMDPGGMDRIPNARQVWGVCIPIDNWAGGFTYMCARNVLPGADGSVVVPEGMLAHTAAPARYAVWRYDGPLEEMSLAFRQIYSERLSAAGLTPIPGGIALENYQPDCWDEATKTMHCDLYVTVE